MSSVYNLLYTPSTGEIVYGSLGIQGFQGLGQQGSQGFQGRDLRGFQGFSAGFAGAQGLQGFQGTFGPDGHQGSNGPIGQLGLQGFRGTVGVTGIQGLQGRQGFQGRQGRNGILGREGRMGPTGTYPVQSQFIAIGQSAGSTGQSITSMAVGQDAGSINQQPFAVALGYQAGLVAQAANSIILNASGAAQNAGTTGFFVNPIRFSEVAPIPFGLQGLHGVQGYQGYQGPQGFQGFQGLQGITGVTGIPGGALNNLQYNVGGEFRASGDMTYNSATNNFVFGAAPGRGNGQFNVTGRMSQGNVAAAVRPGTMKLAYNTGGKWVEVGTTDPNASFVAIHSLDGPTGTALYDTLLISYDGTVGESAGGRLDIYGKSFYLGNANSGSLTEFKNGAFQFGIGAERSFAANDVILSGLLDGTTANVPIFTSNKGGLFNVMMSSQGASSGRFLLNKFWVYRNSSTSFQAVTLQVPPSGQVAFTKSADPGNNLAIPVVNNGSGGYTVYLTNTTTVPMYYTLQLRGENSSAIGT